MRVGAAFGGSRAAWIYAALAGGVAVAAVAGFLAFRGGEEAPPDAVATPEAPASVPEPADTAEVTAEVVEAAPEEDAAADNAADADAAAATDTAEAPRPAPPRFDQIRVAPDGAAVVAGRGPAGADVRLMLDGAEVASAAAASDGGFAAIFAIPPSAAPRIMTLTAMLPDGGEVAGVESVIISPFGGTPDATAEAAPVDPPATAVSEPSGETAVASAGIEAAPETEMTAEREVPEAPGSDAPGAAPEVATGPAPEALPAGEAVASTGETAEPLSGETQAERTADATPAEPAAGTARTETAAASEGTGADAAAPPPETVAGVTAPEAPEVGAAPATEIASAPSIVIAGPEGLRVVQSAGAAPEGGSPAAPPAAQTEVRLDAIAYDLEGGVVLSGRGPADGQVQILLDNRPIELGEIGPGGNWSLDLPDVDPGTYTLTVAQLSPEGEIEARVDTPFLREDPARIAASPMLVEAGVSVITVQPGFTLWGIAEANFGEGIAYVQIFEENRGAIRNPDLIFPGQIFRLPDLPRTNTVP